MNIKSDEYVLDKKKLLHLPQINYKRQLGNEKTSHRLVMIYCSIISYHRKHTLLIFTK